MSPSNKKVAHALEGAPRLVIATVGLMEEMIGVFAREIDIVLQRKTAEHPDLLKYKQKLAMDYNANMKAIAEQPEMMKKLNAEAKAVLRDMAQKLAKAADDNARALRAAINASQQLIQNIMSMIRTEVLAKPSYKNPATAHMDLGSYSPTCRPVAVSRSV